MFGSRKQVIFSSSNYANGQYKRPRRMPRWLIAFLAGVITGGGGYWFLQTNYGPQRLSVEESARLNAMLNDVEQEKNNLQRQLSETQLAVKQANETIQQLQPIQQNHSTQVTDSASEDKANSVSEIAKQLPPDPSNNPVGIRIGNFQGRMGVLNYELVLTKSEEDVSANARIEITTTGHYRNGNRGFEVFPAQNITLTEYTRLQGRFDFTKPTLTPKSVEVKVIDVATKKLIGQRSFEVFPETVEKPSEEGTPTQ